jgi:nicotinate phosphoribosyltransferase
MGNSVLATDGYKFSMAAAGFPLRKETFYYSHRRGGPHLLPFDVEQLIRSMLPGPLDEADPEDARFLDAHGYQMGGAYWAAMAGDITVQSLPKGSWFFDREPVFTVTGPSALVSWLEPLALQLHYRIQVATLAKLGTADALRDAVGTVSCDAQRDIVLDTLAAVGVDAPPIQIDEDGYAAHVRTRVSALVDIVEDPRRVFEVGMRAATCMAQHRIALAAAQEVGLQATSNVTLAQQLGMKPVGTMGHEHVQRFGSDAAAFRAMRDRHPGPTSFLLDTFSTIHSGLPTAFDLVQEDPSRGDTVRFDSGDKETQFLIACSMARHRGIQPRFILEDGFNAGMTQRFEDLRRLQGLPPSDVLYGYGGHIVRSPFNGLTRDRVAAVWKVTQSGPFATMKFGDEPGSGKESIPGRPVLYRRYDGARWVGVVGQDGETMAQGDVPVMGPDVPLRVQFTPAEASAFALDQGPRPLYSTATQALVDTLTAARKRALKGG